MTDRGGSPTYAIAMSSGVSGGDTPSGDIIYITSAAVSLRWANATKINYQPARQSFSIKDAKKHWEITIDNVMISLQQSGSYNNAMEELNEIISYIEDWSDLSHAPVYLFVANSGLNGTHTLMQFRDNTGTDREYLKGYPTNFSPKLEGKVTYVTGSLTFKECWI